MIGIYQNEEHKRRVIERGDGYEYIGSYHRNEVTLDGKKSKSHIRVKCPYCSKEYDVRLDHFDNGVKCSHCCNSYENSFAYYIQQELQEPLNKYWDWEKNTVNPYCVTPQSHKKVYIKCDEKVYHNSYKTTLYHFYKGDRCPYCSTRHGKVNPKDSFGQWLIDTYGEDAIKKYWSPKNKLDPFQITKANTKKIYIYCQNKDYHNDKGGYTTTPQRFYNGNRCGYCYNQKTHPKDSFGSLYPEKAKYWSKNNKKSPFEASPMSNKKYKFICEKCGKEFERSLNSLNRKEIGVVCRDCNSSQGESNIMKWLDKNNIMYIQDKSYFDDLIGCGNGLLKPDFILPNERIWIEYDGEFHYNKIYENDSYDIIQEHDKRKDEYAKEHNWKLIRIPYWEFDNIEEILEKEINKNN